MRRKRRTSASTERCTAARSPVSEAGRWLLGMKLRFRKRQLFIIPIAMLIAYLFPHDLMRNPPFSRIPKAPRNPDIISCYSVPSAGEGETGPFWGKSTFGRFWAWRRNLNKLDGLHTGPRNKALEDLWGMPAPLNVLIYRQQDGTEALLYSKIPSPNSGSLGGYIRIYSKRDGQWNLEADDWDTLTDISIYADKIQLVARVGGIACLVVLALFVRTCMRNRRAN